MKNFISTWFAKLLDQQKKAVPMAEHNRLLLINDLKKCKTITDIKFLREVLKLCAADFSTRQFVDLTLDISYKLLLIEYCAQNLKAEYYPAWQISGFFKNAGRYAICDAILLHIEINKSVYQSKHNDLTIFKRMAERQKTFLLDGMQKHSA